MPPRFLHVDLDAFFVEVCRQRHPELKDIELLVVGGRREQRGVVQSASYGARKHGVRSGMSIAEAVRRCPGATFFQGSFAHYIEASRTVHGILEPFSPVVAMASLDEAYLDFSGTELLHPVSLLPVASRIREGVKRDTGLDCSIGIGPNRMVAKLASDAAKPRGLMEVRPGWEEGFVAGLELRALPGIGPKTAAGLARLGLNLVWQVQQMGLEALEGLLGSEAKALKHRAHGHGGTTLTANRQAKSISRETTLSKDSTDRERLDRLLTLFSARVAAQLRDEGLSARTVQLKLRHGDFHTVTRRITLAQATDLDAEIYAAAVELFGPAYEEVRRRNQGVRLIGVGVSNINPSEPADLFEPGRRTRLREITTAVDRIRGKYGFDSVKAGKLVPKPRD
ncbi:MAG: DNA polymerase IV [Gemmatimonadota bacterium]